MVINRTEQETGMQSFILEASYIFDNCRLAKLQIIHGYNFEVRSSQELFPVNNLYVATWIWTSEFTSVEVCHSYTSLSQCPGTSLGISDLLV